MNNTNIITIEKNVPIPERTYGTSTKKYLFLKSMDVGDSFVVDKNNPDFDPVYLDSIFIVSMQKNITEEDILWLL